MLSITVLIDAILKASILVSVCIMSVDVQNAIMFIFINAEIHHAEQYLGECSYPERYYAECHNGDCPYAECHHKLLPLCNLIEY